MTLIKNTAPPPITHGNCKRDHRYKRLVWIVVLAGLSVFSPVGLRLLGLIRPFSVPTGGMTPAISAGDNIMVEDFSYLSRKPRRGDIVIFKTDEIPSLPASSIYVKRIAGEPGELLQISDGKLYINKANVVISNAYGEITYYLPPHSEAHARLTYVTVPAGYYYVLGDNSTNSHDSRFWGFVPSSSILGRVSFCFWPPKRIGIVK